MFFLHLSSPLGDVSAFSLTVRYELRVLVDFLRDHRGWPKVYTGPAAKVSWCDLARNYNGLSALCSFEHGITMV